MSFWAGFISSFSLSRIGKDHAVSNIGRTSFAKISLRSLAIIQENRGRNLSIITLRNSITEYERWERKFIGRPINNSKSYRENVCIKNVSSCTLLKTNLQDLNSQLIGEENFCRTEY